LLHYSKGNTSVSSSCVRIPASSIPGPAGPTPTPERSLGSVSGGGSALSSLPVATSSASLRQHPRCAALSWFCSCRTSKAIKFGNKYTESPRKKVLMHRLDIWTRLVVGSGAESGLYRNDESPK